MTLTRNVQGFTPRYASCRGRHSFDRGFTLIELAALIIIFGFLMVGALRSYESYLWKKKIEQEFQTIEKLSASLYDYFSENGRYPCPAPLDGSPDNPNFGLPTDCTKTEIANGCGTDSDGNYYCAWARTFDHDDDPATANITERVRMGAVPFRFGVPDDPALPNEAGLLNGLDIGGEYAMDPYKNKILYVLTERQGTDNYIFKYGAVRVEDEFGQVLNNNADFILLSHGRDGKGAFSGEGGAGTPCGSEAGVDNENCDFLNGGGDAVFVSALRNGQPGNGWFDDTVVYRPWVTYFLWDISDGKDPDSYKDIENLNTGNIGIGTKDPQDRVHVLGGDVKAKQITLKDPKTGNIVIDYPGELYSERICLKDGTGCFDPEAIGGDTMAKCGAIEAMTGVANADTVCARTLNDGATGSCPAGYYIYGYTYASATKTLTLRCVNPLTGDKIP